MVNNLLIARKTYRPREGVAMFIFLKCIYLNDRFRLALVKILTSEKMFKKGNVNGKKSKGMENREEKNTEKG